MFRRHLLSSFMLYLLIARSYGASLGVFDDSVLFDVSWPGLLPDDSPLTNEVKDLWVNAVMNVLLWGLSCSRMLEEKI